MASIWIIKNDSNNDDDFQTLFHVRNNMFSENFYLCWCLFVSFVVPVGDNFCGRQTMWIIFSNCLSVSSIWFSIKIHFVHFVHVFIISGAVCPRDISCKFVASSNHQVDLNLILITRMGGPILAWWQADVGLISTQCSLHISGLGQKRSNSNEWPLKCWSCVFVCCC